jgi:hypothetical protein
LALQGTLHAFVLDGLLELQLDILGIGSELVPVRVNAGDWFFVEFEITLKLGRLLMLS